MKILSVPQCMHVPIVCWVGAGEGLVPCRAVPCRAGGRGGGGGWAARSRKMWWWWWWWWWCWWWWWWRNECGGEWAANIVNRPPHQLAQPRCANYWAPLTRKRHQQEHRPQRPSEYSDPTQHAQGRTGDCQGPREETATDGMSQGGLVPWTV